MFRSNAAKISLIILLALLVGYYDLPNNLQVIPGMLSSVKDARVHLGLDLQGGSQLDYKVDLRKVDVKDQKSIVEGVKNVINRRVNSLGVSEPNIYTSSVGNEQHIIVELAGVKDLNEAKRIVGKVISLEFKEKREKEDPNYKDNIKKLADSVLRRILAAPNNFGVIAQEEVQAFPGKEQFRESDWVFANELTDKKISNAIAGAKVGLVIPNLLEGSEGYTVQDGQLVPMQGFFIVKITDRRDASALPQNEKVLEVSHILVSYRGAERAPDTVLRSKEEAKAEAENILKQLQAGGNFEKSAKEKSDEPAAKDSAGALSAPVREGGDYDPSFTAAALKLDKKGQLSAVTESPFGFHIIRADNFTQMKYSELFFSTAPDPWQSTGLTGQQFEHAEVTFNSNSMQPVVSIKFNPEGAKLFEEITGRNVSKPIAIFVDGALISAPNVQEKISGGSAVITNIPTAEEAQSLARDLNTGAIPAPILLSGQYTIGAALGSQALSQSMKAGVIGVILLALFMILYYRLPGLIAILALSIYTVILTFLIKSELPLALSIGIGILVFAGIVYTILKSRDGPWEKFVTFVLACFVLFFVTFLLSSPVVLTLAGIAGVILSIGMAVDANILIFERIKEELRSGRPLQSSIDVGFDRAWSSIRDSNFSSLITCAILYFFGTSIIQGFAFNLAAGILVSMFTAITITKTLLRTVINTKLGEKLWLWGASNKPSERHPYKIVEKAKLWFGFSGTLLVVCIVALVVFGLKLGIDFTGGTLMDLTFTKPVTAQQIKSELNIVQQAVNSGASTSTPAPGKEVITSAKEPIDLVNGRIIEAGTQNTFLINLPHIDNETHDKIIAQFNKKFGAVTENKFTTIGPVVGDTLKQKAVFAVIIAMIAIVLYIAFAFRKIPKRVSPWKFGVCAVVALLHDVLIPIGIFSIFHFEVDALFITAILTVLGFSVHDTIVVFDRIRENLKYQGRDETFAQIADKSMTQTMTRSINTSFTVFITLASLLLFGSASIFNFILVLTIGIVVGTYSSIFIASPLLVLWQKKEGMD